MFRLISSAFNDIFSYSLHLEGHMTDILSFLALAECRVIYFLSKILTMSKAQYKCRITLETTYYHPIMCKFMEYSHSSDLLTLLTPDDVFDFYSEVVEKMKQSDTEFYTTHSFWRLDSVNYMTITLYRFDPLCGGEGSCNVKKIKACKSVIDVPDTDGQCFMFSILAKFVKKPSNKSSYTPDLKLRYKWPKYPTSLNDIDQFQIQNPISINVYAYNEEEDYVFPLKIAKQDREDHRNILLLNGCHYLYIKNFSRFMSTMDRKQKLYHFCPRCLQKFNTEKQREKHFNSCYATYFHRNADVSVKNEIPLEILKKNAVTAVHCGPEDSFRLAVLTGLSEDRYDWSGVQSSQTSILAIKNWEKKNPQFSINVYSFSKNGKIFPLKATNRVRKNHRDLLQVRTEYGIFFNAIHDLSKLLRSQGSKHKGRLLYCRRCLSRHYSAEKLALHTKLCTDSAATGRIVLPNQEDKWLKFKDYKALQRMPVVIFVDTEAMLIPEKDKNFGSSTTVTHRHEVSSFCMYTVSEFEEDKQPRCYRGDNAMTILRQWIEEEVRNTAEYYDMVEPVHISAAERQKMFNEADFCGLCEKPLGQDKVLDHCHNFGDGTPRSVCHSKCNILFSRPKVVPVIIHNLQYDIAAFVKSLAGTDGTVSVVPTSEEKFISLSRRFCKFVYKFIDSFKFLSTSLSELVDLLEEKDFVHTSRHFSPELLPLLRKKQIFPYEYIDSWSKYDETQFPKKEDFYNTLNDEEISDEDYDHAKQVWDMANIQTLGEYSDFYCKSDTLFLADVWECFRTKMMKEYRLDPSHYLTLPQYGFSAMLLNTKVELENLTDVNMLLFFQKGTRGGIACCTKKLSVAQNKDLGAVLQEDEESTSINLIDCVSLYSWALSQMLPHHSYRWMTRSELDQLDILKINDEDSVGYTLMVDLHVPPEVGRKTADFPFCHENERPPFSKENKLLGTVADKQNYIIHSRALKQALEHGLVLKKVHMGVTYYQSAFLRPFIEHTIQLRRESTSDFEKLLYKSICNSLYGKFCENVNKRMDFELVTNATRFRKVVKDNFFDRATIFDENLLGVHRRRKMLKYNKPIPCAFACLGISKTKMYSFYYDVLKAVFKDKISLLIMDTDSFGFELRKYCFLDFMAKNPKYFDTSNFDKSHFLYSKRNKKRPGTFTNEFAGVPIKLFVGLRAKMYMMETADSVKKKSQRS